MLMHGSSILTLPPGFKKRGGILPECGPGYCKWWKTSTITRSDIELSSNVRSYAFSTCSLHGVANISVVMQLGMNSLYVPHSRTQFDNVAVRVA